MDLPRSYTIRESSHRILNPFTAEKLATLGAALRLPPGITVLDLCSGKGELLCSWARDHGITGTGVDISTVSLEAARGRADELGVAGAVRFVHADASSYVSDEAVDLAACIGASWIGGGVAGTVALLERSLRPGGLLLNLRAHPVCGTSAASAGLGCLRRAAPLNRPPPICVLFSTAAGRRLV